MVNCPTVLGLRTNSVTTRPLSFNTNKLFYGDNLDILRTRIPNRSIDLIYLDPPFNSKAGYNVLFKETSGEQSTAQIQAFSDFWHWDAAARESYNYLVSNAVDHKIASLAEALYRMLGKNDLTAYVFMMTTRLIELYRVLKNNGTLFLHCDPTASHYLKLVLDAIFGAENFRNEIIWKRTFAHNDANQCGAVHDTIFFYSKSHDYKWHPEPVPLSDEYKEMFLDQFDPVLKKRYQRIDLTGAGTTAKGESGRPWRGIDPTLKGRHWAYEHKQLDAWDKEGRIHWPKKKDGMPRLKRYEDEMNGMSIQDVWTDIRPIHNMSSERVGFQTQKPLTLLERIIGACTDEGDWVLDPFCGCGTAVIASEKLRRHWIGIDVTWLAINLVKTRLKELFLTPKFEMEGEPRDLGAAEELAKNRYQFQWWALSLIGARPVGSKSDNPREGKKGADEGIDGWLRFRDGEKVESIVVQVKSGHVGVKDIREQIAVIARQKAAMGIFITLSEPTHDMNKEVKAEEPYVMNKLKLRFPKIQIITIEQLLRGIKPELPDTASAFDQAPLAKRVSNRANYRLDDQQMQST
jgi:DNA modification methylase